MQSKILSKRALVTAVLVGFGLFAVLLFDFIPKNPTAGSIQGQSIYKLPTLPIGRPMRLEIPLINLNAPVEQVGLTSEGAMDVPQGQASVAWFELGPRPGETGSAAIAGHFGLKNGKASVFDNLHKLSKGDKIYVEDDQGVISAFVVVDSRSYDPKANASDVFGSSDGKAHLNLITCEGVWNQAQQSYSHRLVVFTEKVIQ